MPGTVLDAKNPGDFSNWMYSDTSSQDSESGEGTEHSARLLNWELMGHPGVNSSRKLEPIPKSTPLHHAGGRLRGKVTGPPGSSKPLCAPGQ